MRRILGYPLQPSPIGIRVENPKHRKVHRFVNPNHAERELRVPSIRRHANEINARSSRSVATDPLKTRVLLRTIPDPERSDLGEGDKGGSESDGEHVRMGAEQDQGGGRRSSKHPNKSSA